MDNHLDEVARALTTARPPHDLRRRVLRRIADGGGDRSWALAGRLVPAIAVLVAAVVLGVTMWPEPQSRPDVQIQPAPGAEATGPAPARAQSQREPDALPATQPDPPPLRPRTASASAVLAPEAARSATSELAPEPMTIAAIVVDTLAAPESTAIEPLDVTALSVTRLDMEPIGSQGGLQ